MGREHRGAVFRVELGTHIPAASGYLTDFYQPTIGIDARTLHASGLVLGAVVGIKLVTVAMTLAYLFFPVYGTHAASFT